MALSENPTLEEIIDEIDRLNNLIVDRGGAKTITPKTTNQVLAKGNYKGDITIKGDANLVASNILQGKSIFGVQGSLERGKKWASGTVNLSSINVNSVTISNLSFKPSSVILFPSNTSSYYDDRNYLYGTSLGRANNASESGAGKYLSYPDWYTGTHEVSCNISTNGFTLSTDYIFDAEYIDWIAYE